MNLPAISLPDPSKPIEDQDLHMLFAMCIFGEARGETDLARRAVAQVVLNRATHPLLLFGSKRAAGFDANVRAVILRPNQFSSLNPGDPNYHKLWYPLAHALPQVWDRCVYCASAALAAKDRPDTLTSNSDHYFDDSILPPSWASPTNQTVKIGRLNFFRLYLPHPGDSSPENAPPSSGPSPDASLRTPQRGEKTETGNSSAALSRGSRPSAKILPELATTLPASPALPLDSRGNEPAGPEDTPATGPQSPRPSRSSPAPQSPSATPRASRSYSPYAWGRRLSLLTEKFRRRSSSVSEFGIVNPEFVPDSPYKTSNPPSVHLLVPAIPSNALLPTPKGRSVSILPAPEGRTVNSRRFQPTEPKPTHPHQPRTGFPPFSNFSLPRRHCTATKKFAIIFLLVFAFLATACSDLEKAAYRTLAVTQAEYETVQDKVAESAARSLITEAQWERFQVLGHRFIAAHNAAVDAFSIWSQSKQPADTARLQAMLDLLPGLIVDINTLVDSFIAPPASSPNTTPASPTTAPTIHPQLDQPLDSSPSVAHIFLRQNHGGPAPALSKYNPQGRTSRRGHFSLPATLLPTPQRHTVSRLLATQRRTVCLLLTPQGRTVALLFAPQGRTVNSRRFQPTEPPPIPPQPRTGLPAFAAATVRARFQPCQKPSAQISASAPEARFPHCAFPISASPESGILNPELLLHPFRVLRTGSHAEPISRRGHVPPRSLSPINPFTLAVIPSAARDLHFFAPFANHTPLSKTL